ncbi:MAG TPA: response regulator transcription factor [Bryobacteraceae bacterium]|jgi:DNA-binding NarL/FixJ family response regulator
MIPVYVVASSAVVRAGLESVVCSSPALELAQNEATAEVLLAAPSQLTEDRITTLSNYSLPVVVLVDLPEAPVLASALRANIRAILSPEAGPDEILAAINSAAAGLLTLQPAALDLLAQGSRVAAESLDDPLTPRELEVLAMLAEGLSNKLLAYRLGISEHTVKFHITSILTKLQAGSRTDAVMQGIRRGLIMM